MSLLWDIVQIGFNFLLLGILFALWQAYKRWSPRWDYRKGENDALAEYRAMKKKKKEGRE